jgi:hypothetical protein
MSNTVNSQLFPVVFIPLFANPNPGGMDMNAKDYWTVFLETGAPEAYLLYSAALKTEGKNVPDDSGRCPENNGLQ